MATKRRGLIRFQIVLLMALAVLIIYRVVKGPPPPEGLVAFVGMEPHDLRHAAIELDERTEVAVRATGSFDQETPSAGLAAQGWIVRRADRKVVWKMDPGAIERGRGSLAHVRGDTLALEAGRYDVYFASYGQDASNRRSRWRSEADRWQLVLGLIDETTPARLLHGQRLGDSGPPEDRLVWRTAPLGNSQQREYLFEVKQPTTLDIYAVGEIDNEPQDYAWIEDAATGTHVWGFSKDNTKPAGGLATNRRFEGTLELQPGAYRAVSKSNRRHAYARWEGNPPFDPAAWGLTLQTADPSTISAFDPWMSREPLVSFTRVPDNARLSRRFEVSEPIHVVIYATGEITDRHSVYDYGELLKEEASRKRSVWKLTWDASLHAGGGKKNRLEVAFLTLEPGVYTFRYESDGSHSFEEWNDGRPDYPERWGATLFPMAAALDSGVVTLLDSPEGDRWAMPNAPRPAPVVHVGDAIVDWTRLRGEVSEAYAFTLEQQGKLHIVALGEIAVSNKYDYGWIEHPETGETVWEMTRDNTSPAGGGSNNRLFDGIVELPPGRYVIHFVTDGSHHYGSFGDDVPENAENWGITIHYAAPAEEGDH